MEKKDIIKIYEEGDQAMRTHFLNNYPEEMKECFSPIVNPGEINEIQDTNEHNENSETIQQSENIPKNKDVKKLYRKIAAKIHPDKIDSDKYSVKFEDAFDAYKNNDLAMLLEIASAINIEVSQLSAASIFLLEQNIASLEESIANKKITFGYQWAIAENDDVRKKLTQMWFKEKGIKISD
tara:strand:+ start:324 stop:866 length:543 start_codon:yes stop_codon:yes gene_type:complete